MIERGDEKVIQIPDDFFDKLASLTEELAIAIDGDNDVYEILQKIAIRSYSLTGNGYYLYQKGIIKV
jgi:DNA replication initiation complex subunit (GINS family)